MTETCSCGEILSRGRFFPKKGSDVYFGPRTNNRIQFCQKCGKVYHYSFAPPYLIEASPEFYEKYEVKGY